jgi:levansucrase
VATIARSADNTIPTIDPASLSAVLPGRYVWDYWPIRTPDGSVADLGDGRIGWVALSVPDDIEPEDRHFIASLRFASSWPGDAVWADHGELFPAGLGVGARQWAGSTVYHPHSGRVDVYYTACGVEGEEVVTFEQRLVHASGRLGFVAGVPTIGEWSPHRIALEGDGEIYASTIGEAAIPGRVDAFRDPAYFADPSSGEDYLLFTATVAGSGDDFDGAVGVAHFDGDGWRLLPPLVTAVGVNKELERPHLIHRDGRYYLFFTTHHWTFAPGGGGPEGLYGFVGDALVGPYAPLNGSGLVLGNPQLEPHQSYSWLVLGDGSVLSFADYPGLRGRDLEGELTMDPTFKKRHFAGTTAPALRIAIDGATAVLG